ncbi:MAG: PQQ-binding-like beta-propeller repeat protein [Pirellulales bacterium]
MKRQCKLWRAGVRAFAGLVMTAAALCAQAGDWNFVRRDLSSSGVAESQLPKQLDVLWTYSAAGEKGSESEDAGFEATAIVDNRIVYIGDNYGTFHAVLMDDGRGVWKQPIENSAFLAGAAFNNQSGALYAGDANGTVWALSNEDGHELWESEIGGEVYAGPTIHGDDVLVTCEAGTLACLNVADGQKRWDFKIEAPLRCTPTIADGQILLAGCDSKLHLIDASTGKESSTIGIDAPTGATAAYRDGRVYFGTEGGTFYAIELPKDGQSAKILWTYKDEKRGQPIRAAAAVTDSLVVYGSQGKAIYGLDRETGEVKWTVPTRTHVDSSPVIAGDKVVAATIRGVLYVIDAKTGSVDWQYDAGGSFTASPVVVDGQIIIGNGDGTLYCFGAKEKGNDE